jgi:UDP-glucose:(heptosyl)LPS alpha-1,3-glucosyltransferase
MEAYVYYLTRALAKLGVDIVILCEEDLSAAGHPPNLAVHAIGVTPMRRPRWKAMECFRNRVQPEVVRLKKDGYLIHSHERIAGHHVSTQHGPLMTGRVNPLAVFFSKRLRRWLKFEREELDCLMVLPVSSLLRSDIEAISNDAKLGPGAWPGMIGNEKSHPKPLVERSNHIIFVGREVKRKGLDIAIDIMREIRLIDPIIELHVYGASEHEVPRKWRLPFIRYFGWLESVPYHKYKTLIHPARIEPYGMAVAEALSQGVSCFVSNRTGILGLRDQISGLDLHELVSLNGARDCAVQISRFQSDLKGRGSVNTKLGGSIPWSWSDLAKMHYDHVYLAVL